METLIEKAQVLMEALPYIRKFSGKTIVIKYGGNAMLSEQLKEDFARNLVLLKCIGINPIVVHGGGPQIDELMRRLGIKIQFASGVRCTSPEAMEVVEMVLTGQINKDLVSLINHHGGKAIGLSGKDGDLIQAEKRYLGENPFSGNNKGIDIGLVGRVININTRVLELLDSDRFIPVIAPVGVGHDRTTYNINSDEVAGAVAAALRAEKLVYLTDVAGVYDKDEKILSSISEERIQAMILEGTIAGGMLPKIQSCLYALRAGVNKAHIVDGRISHALLLEIFTDEGIGTEIVRSC
ncbi:MAG: acetylglutamate kinase [Candidatus Schekmanbacteria bacterium]|nr:acetylglutamate kinase [Candidatus Schekmanbacteria bacterium]